MTSRIRQALSILVVALIQLTSAQAQVFVEQGFSTLLDDNINNNALQTKDRISVLQLSAGYGWEMSQWNALIGYNGNINYYHSVTDRTNQSHAAVLSLVRPLGEGEEDAIGVDFSLSRGYYRGDYSLYNHFLGSARVSTRGMLSERTLAKGEYTVRSMSFSALPDFNYVEHDVAGSVSVAAAENTTIIGEAEFGSRFYRSTGASDGRSTGSAVSQLTGGVRIGQGLDERTGISVAAKYQWNLRKEMKSLLLTYGVVSDDELFDDHFGYEGLHPSLMLTHWLTESAMLRMTIGSQERIYTSLPAYDDAGSVIAGQRIDRRSYVALTFRQGFASGISFQAALEMIKNSSNDPFYHYSNQALTLQLGYSF